MGIEGQIWQKNPDASRSPESPESLHLPNGFEITAYPAENGYKSRKFRIRGEIDPIQLLGATRDFFSAAEEQGLEIREDGDDYSLTSGKTKRFSHEAIGDMESVSRTWEEMDDKKSIVFMSASLGNTSVGFQNLREMGGPESTSATLTTRINNVELLGKFLSDCIGEPIDPADVQRLIGLQVSK